MAEQVACYVDGCGQPSIPGLRGCPEHALEDVVCKHGNPLKACVECMLDVLKEFGKGDCL